MPLNPEKIEELAALLRAAITEAGASAPANDEAGNAKLARNIEAAYEAFEADTGFSPFLVQATAPATTRKFAARGGMVNFGAGLFRLDEVRVCGAPVENAFGSSGFSLCPANATPATYLLFDEAFTTPPGAVEIEGQWGFCTALSTIVEEALICRAATLFISLQSVAQEGGAVLPAGAVKKREDEGVSVEFVTGSEGKTGEIALQSRGRTIAEMRTVYREAVKKHRLI